MQKRKVIGFDRKVEIQWLDAVLDRVAAGSDLATTRAFLHEMLKPQHPAKEARQKTAGIITRIWQLVTPEHSSIRDDALALLTSIPPRERVWLHWGMASLTDPLFLETAAAIGRLLKLQGDFTLAQLERRLIEDWGDRSTLKRAAQRIVRSMVQWGALTESGRGQFRPASKLTTRSKELQLWFLETAHRAEQNGEVESHQLMNLPMAFPFQITIGLGDLRRSKHFMIHRQGLDMDMVAVRSRKTSSETANVA
jgi:hypothetical protein